MHILNSFKAKLFTLIMALIVTVLLIAMAIFSPAIEEFEDQQLKKELNNVRGQVVISMESLTKGLNRINETSEKSLIDSYAFQEDEETINSFLPSLLSRSGTDLIMLIRKDAKIIGQIWLDRSSNAPKYGSEQGNSFRYDLNTLKQDDSFFQYDYNELDIKSGGK